MNERPCFEQRRSWRLQSDRNSYYVLGMKHALKNSATTFGGYSETHYFE